MKRTTKQDNNRRQVADALGAIVDLCDRTFGKSDERAHETADESIADRYQFLGLEPPKRRAPRSSRKAQ